MKTKSLITRAVGAVAAAIFTGLCGWQNLAGAQTLAAAQTVTMNNSNAPTEPANTPVLSYGASQAVDMYQRGVKPDVIVGYIMHSSAPYELSANAIIYMKSLGVPVKIVNAMLQRDAELHEQALSAGAEGPKPATQMVSPYPPLVQPGVIPDDAYAPYDYPDYDEFWPPVVVGGDWGWGWGWGGHWGHHWGHYRGGFHGGFHGGFGGGFHGGGGFGGGHGGGGHR